MNDAILQTRLPYPMPDDRLPGTGPMDPADWILVDDCFAAQMALREQLLSEKRADVLRMDPSARPAAAELLEELLAHLPDSYGRDGGAILRPDGVRVTPDPADPLATAGRLCSRISACWRNVATNMF